MTNTPDPVVCHVMHLLGRRIERYLEEAYRISTYKPKEVEHDSLTSW
jgi:hypothetical protein